MVKVDAVGLKGMKQQTKTYLSEIDLDNISRKYHNKVLFDIAALFRAQREILHKQMVVR